MELELKRHTYTFKPTAYTSSEVCKVMSVSRGTLVLAVALRVGVLFDNAPTISIGDAVGGGHGDVDGFMTTGQAAIGATGLKAGWGAYFSGANGRLYSEVDIVTDSRKSIDITYTANPATTQGECTVIIVYAEVE